MHSKRKGEGFYAHIKHIADLWIAISLRLYLLWQMVASSGELERMMNLHLHTLEDGVDYVPAKASVLMGHHFLYLSLVVPSKHLLAPLYFSWHSVVIWVLVGGIFFGGVARL